MPAISRLRPASSIIRCDIRSAQGPSHSEHTPTPTTMGSAIQASGRRKRFGPTPIDTSTGISASRYSLPMASINPSITASGRIIGSHFRNTRPSWASSMPAGTLPRATSPSTSANAPPSSTIRTTASTAKVLCTNSRIR